jgi:hypothetical protein
MDACREPCRTAPTRRNESSQPLYMFVRSRVLADEPDVIDAFVFAIAALGRTDLGARRRFPIRR